MEWRWLPHWLKGILVTIGFVRATLRDLQGVAEGSLDLRGYRSVADWRAYQLGLAGKARSRYVRAAMRGLEGCYALCLACGLADAEARPLAVAAWREHLAAPPEPGADW